MRILSWVSEKVQRSYPFFPLIPAVLIVLSWFMIEGASFLWLVGTGFCFFLFDSLGVQIGVHKLLCHRAFHSTPLMKVFLIFLSVFSGQGSPFIWYAVHVLSHHPHSDSEKDIHSPRHGKWFSFVAWYWKSRTTEVFRQSSRAFSREDRRLFFFHRHHALLLLGYWVLLATIKLEALVYLGALPVLLSVASVGFVNCFLHSDGALSRVIFLKYRHRKEVDIYNSFWLGPLTMGLGYHDNHHTSPSALFYEERWYEFDPSRFIIPFLESKQDRPSP